jgi:hypothetical protein
MPFSSENLLRQLDQPGTIHWAPELKNRKDAFAFLSEAVRGNRLNPAQFHNALHMLFRMAFPENAEEVLQIFSDLAGHQDVAIRSEAVQLAIGLLRTSTNLKTPLLFSDAQERSVREAMSRGLTTKAANLTRKFFAK